MGITAHPPTADTVTSSTELPPRSQPFMSVGLIILIVLATLCAILGAIYAYIYYTRINPRSARARKYVETNPSEEEDGKPTHTHLFLFRK